MRIRIEVDDGFLEEEVIIRCRGIGEEVIEIQRMIESVLAKQREMIFYKEETEYFFLLEKILFFETEGTRIHAHTFDDVYQVKYKLYELEELLPPTFMRVSKSTILNVNHVYSITRNLTSSSVVELKGTHKQVYVSRHYYKLLKEKLLEKRRAR